MKRNPTQDREAARHAKAIKDHERAEKRLVQAQNRWQKTRAALRRYEAVQDKKFAKRSGGYDMRDLAKSAGVEPEHTFACNRVECLGECVEGRS